LPEKCFVTLTVFDALGQKRSLLVSQELESGRHAVNFDGKDFASGVYLYKLETARFTETKKMVLVK
jgi:hypothetical protein